MCKQATASTYTMCKQALSYIYGYLQYELRNICEQIYNCLGWDQVISFQNSIVDFYKLKWWKNTSLEQFFCQNFHQNIQPSGHPWTHLRCFGAHSFAWRRPPIGPVHSHALLSRNKEAYMFLTAYRWPLLYWRLSKKASSHILLDIIQFEKKHPGKYINYCLQLSLPLSWILLTKIP